MPTLQLLSAKLMEATIHGISVGLHQNPSHVHLHLKAIGELTDEDFELMIPLLESALCEIRHNNVLALVDCVELEGWSPDTEWEDFRLGLRYGNFFSKIALLGEASLNRSLDKIADWFTSGQIEYFSTEKEARAWLGDANIKIAG